MYSKVGCFKRFIARYYRWNETKKKEAYKFAKLNNFYKTL